MNPKIHASLKSALISASVLVISDNSFSQEKELSEDTSSFFIESIDIEIEEPQHNGGCGNKGCNNAGCGK